MTVPIGSAAAVSASKGAANSLDLLDPGQHATAASADVVGAAILQPSDTFVRRHIGPNVEDIKQMLEVVGADSLEDLVDQTIPDSIRLRAPLNLGEPRGEFELLVELKGIAAKNKVLRSCI